MHRVIIDFLLQWTTMYRVSHQFSFSVKNHVNNLVVPSTVRVGTGYISKFICEQLIYWFVDIFQTLLASVRRMMLRSYGGGAIEAGPVSVVVSTRRGSRAAPVSELHFFPLCARRSFFLLFTHSVSFVRFFLSVLVRADKLEGILALVSRCTWV